MAVINLDLLNQNQRVAVARTEGRLLILAGAGSGKTKVLTMRMAYLIQEKKVPSESIVGLTFTNKAAKEMRSRLRELIPEKECKKIFLGTFHSFCLKILRQEIHRLGYTESFTIYNENDIERLVRHITRDILNREGDLPSLQPTLSFISKARSKGKIPDKTDGENPSWHDGFARDVYERLNQSLRAYNALDFDSMLSLTVELLEKYPEVLSAYQSKIQYIMIDEYQDTSPVQYRLAELLSQNSKNLCVVGDDDQSIYGWRGAEVHNILGFNDSFVVKLEQNYRSTNKILQAANSLIHHNQTRYKKMLWSSKGDGEEITVFHAPTETDEAESVVYRIIKMKEALNLKWNDFAILYRSNALSRSLEAALLKGGYRKDGVWHRGIPYCIHGGVEFFERKEVKDLLAYLKILINPRDDASLLRIINLPRRGLGEAALDLLTSYNRQNKVPLFTVLEKISRNELNLELPDLAKTSICKFIDLMDKTKRAFQEKPLKDALKDFIEEVNFVKAIAEEVKSEKMRRFKWENVEGLVSELADYEETEIKEGKKAGLVNFLSDMALDDTMGSKKDKDLSLDAVHLMTFHSSKGLEFPYVFLIGIEDHIIPHEKSLLETGIEEERRLLYVAITRAMKGLTLSMAKERKRMGVTELSKPSRFLYEIPKELMRLVRYDNL